MLEIFIATAMNLLGTPYIYGGNSPLVGLDCSGLVMECLRSVGCAPKNDSSAQMLFDHFNEGARQCHRPTRGDLIFFGRSITEVSHIGIALDAKHMVESGGGDRRCKTVQIATKMDARVRIRPIDNRRDYLTAIRIF